MSTKEINQLKIFEKLKNKEISQIAVAKILGLTDRQVRNKLKRYVLNGAKGLIHKNRGRRSNRKWYKNERENAMNLLKGDFQNFGPTFASEKLCEIYNIKVSNETLRKEMIKEGLWVRKKRKIKHRQWRERKKFFGEMIQLDGSTHDWFEGRALKCTLLVFIDDATSQLVWLEFAKSESNESLMRSTKSYVSSLGGPNSFYTDYGSVFHVNLNNADHEKTTQFERALSELDIEIIHARSPQAKGRVERANATLQDRLVKEFRLADISSIADANKFVRHKYIDFHNKKFAVIAASKHDVHRSCKGFDLDNIFCIKEKQILQNNFVVRYKKRILQLHSQQKTIIYPKDKITISEKLDGTISLAIRKTKLCFGEIKTNPIQSPQRGIDLPIKLVVEAHKRSSLEKKARSFPFWIKVSVNRKLLLWSKPEAFTLV